MPGYDVNNWHKQPEKAKRAVVQSLQEAHQQLLMGISELVLQAADGTSRPRSLSVTEVDWNRERGVVRPQHQNYQRSETDPRVQAALQVAQLAVWKVAENAEPGQQSTWQTYFYGHMNGIKGDVVEDATTSVAHTMLSQGFYELTGFGGTRDQAFSAIWVDSQDPRTYQRVRPELREPFRTGVVAAWDSYLTDHPAWQSTIR